MHINRAILIVLVFLLIIFNGNKSFASGNFKDYQREQKLGLKIDETLDDLLKTEEKETLDIVSILVIIVIMVIIAWVFTHMNSSGKSEELTSEYEQIFKTATTFN